MNHPITDIHCHIIPSIDDGPEGSSIALEMLQYADELGIQNIIATPHFSPYEGKKKIETIKKGYDELNKLKIKNSINVNLFLGAEILMESGMIDYLIKYPELRLNGSRYILVEFKGQRIPAFLKRMIFEIELAGFRPIIAHPERCDEIVDKFGAAEELNDKGALLQVNYRTLSGEKGKRIKRKTFRLVESGCIQFAASDAHDNQNRNLDFNAAFDKVQAQTGTEMTRKLFCENSTKVLKDDIIL